MKNITAALLVAFVVVFGLASGYALAQSYACAGPCAACRYTGHNEGDPVGPKRSRQCAYDPQCSCGNDGKTPVSGWCQTEKRKRCSSQSSDPIVYTCYQAQSNCENPAFTPCQSLCSPAD